MNIYNTKFYDKCVKIMIYYHILIFNMILLYYFPFSTNMINIVFNTIDFLVICYCVKKLNSNRLPSLGSQKEK